MIIVPIGVQCTSGNFKNEMQKAHSLPFDSMFSNPCFVYEMLEMLLEQNMNVSDLVRNHFFFCEKRANCSGVEHYYVCPDGFALCNDKYNVIFPHDTVLNEENINKYIRRFQRLKDLILHSPEELYFLYTSQSSLGSGNFTIDGNDVIKNVYTSLNKIYTLISKFRSNFKIILFDGILEEDETLLDKRILFIKLFPCNNLVEQICQLREHKDFFLQ
jgi:hypothetical protein